MKEAQTMVKNRIAGKAIRRLLNQLTELAATAREIPGALVDFLMEHRWAKVLATIVVSILAYLITIALLAVLGAAGYIPSPPW